MKLVLIPFLLLSFGVVERLSAGGAGEQAESGLEVSGTGRIEVAPDTLIVEGGVSVLAETAIAAAQGARVEMERVMDALAAAGVGADQIETTQLSIYGETVPAPDRDREPELRYRARNIIRVRSPQIDRAGELIDVLVSSGVNQLMGVRFAVSQTQPHREAAWRAAVADARRQAEVIAAELGRELGEVRRASVGSGGPSPEPYAMMRAAEASTPVSPGAIEFTQQVRVVFSLE